MAHEIKNILCVCVWGGGGGRGKSGKGTREVIHLFQTVCEGVGNREGDSLISICIEKSSQYVFSFCSVLYTVLCGVVASPTNGLGFESHW